MSIVGESEEKSGGSAEAARAEDGQATALTAGAAVVLDAQAHPCEQVGALVEGFGAAYERLVETVLEHAHSATDLMVPSADSIAARPRWRWVFTELREIPSVSAMPSMPSSW